MLKCVLVAVNCSAYSERTIDAATELARNSGASLDVAFVRCNYRPAADSPLLCTKGNSYDCQAEHQGRVVEHVRASGVQRVTTFTVAADAAQAIVSRSLEIGANVIVLDTEFRTGLAGSWTGSIADRVVRVSAVPVWLVNAKAGSDSAVNASLRTVSARRADALPRRILVPLDGSARSAAILAPVRAIARAWNANVDLVSVVQPLLPTPSSARHAFRLGDAAAPADRADDAERATQILVRLANDQLNEKAFALAAGGGRPASITVVKHPYVAGAIEDCAISTRPDLVAITTHGSGASRLTLGSVADCLVRGDVDVLLLNSDPNRLRRHHEASRMAMNATSPADCRIDGRRLAGAARQPTA